jgi:hypothetical protein
VRFSWRETVADPLPWHAVVIAASASGEPVVQRHRTATGNSLVIPAEQISQLSAGMPYYWRVVAGNEWGTRESDLPLKRFVLDPAAPPAELVIDGIRPRDQMVTEARLHGNPRPAYGRLVEAVGWSPAVGPGGEAASAVETNGTGGRLKYQLVAFPEADYTAALWLQLREYPRTRLGQVISAWTAGMDDPLRLVIEGRQLFARIEAQQAYGTEGTPLQLHTWHHVAVVKQASRLTLFVDGQAAATAQVPELLWSGSTEFAVGGNPRFAGPEYLAARFADLRFWARALTPAEIQALGAATRQPPSP